MLASLFCRRRTPHLPIAEPHDPAQADLALLARALQQLLSKWPPQVTPGAMRLPPHLLSDLCHEIAEHVDASVRQAAVRCLRRTAAARAPVS